MSDIEERILSIPTPQVSQRLDDKMNQLFAELPAAARTSTASTAFAPLTFPQTRKLLMRGLGFASVCAAGVLLFFGLTSGLGGATPAFAQVVESMKELSSVQYLQVGIGTRQGEQTEGVTAPPSVGRDDIVKRIDEIHSQLDSRSDEGQKTRELRSELRVLDEFLEEDAPPLVSLAWNRVVSPGKLRAEVVFPYQAINIHNGDEAVTRDDANRKVTKRKTTILDQKGNPVSVGKADFFSVLLVPDQGVKELPGRAIDGKWVIGFERTLDQRGSTQTWWVEKGTKLPVLIEMKNCFKKDVVSSEMVYREMTYNGAIASDLFDTSAPDGYEVSEQHNTIQFDVDLNDGN